MTDYDLFLEKKKRVHIASGFDVKLTTSHLFSFQSHVVTAALRAGKFGVFSGTGTGKTRMELVWANEVVNHTGKPVLILAPLAVGGQTIAEGKKIEIAVSKYYAPTQGDLIDSFGDMIHISNYEQLENIDLSVYGGIALDEASLLKNHEGAYRNNLIESCKLIPYKSVWTATPSPNDPMELGNYSEFLDVMPRNEMLAMFFVHDGGETSKWRIKGHAEVRFWEWVSTWATMFSHPRDIGFEQDGYDLPPLNIIERQVTTPVKEGTLFNTTSVSATDYNAELRVTMIPRLDIAANIVNNSKERFIVWVKHNEEGERLRKLIPEAIEVKGSDTTEYKEEKLLGFANSEFRVLITKSKIAGAGLNYQSCHNQIFASPDFSFEAVYQSIRRSWRFGQQYPVNAYIVTTDTMENVLKTFHRKQIQHEKMQSEMAKAVNKNIVNKKADRVFEEIKTDNYHFMFGDSVKLIHKIESESIGFSMWSPPFPGMYVYSDQVEDMGNCKDMDEFVIGFQYLIDELFRVMKQGRNVAVHCMDMPILKGREGYIGLRDFSGIILDVFEKAGFIYHSRITLWKDPVIEMTRTKALGLLHKQLKKDSTMSRVGIPDYLLVFRKDGDRTDPVTHQDTDPNAPGYLPVSLWQKYASPVWMDIDQGNTLNYKEGREGADEKHIAPLQLGTIERATILWSNEGDKCLTLYGGIGSEPYTWVKLKRYGVGIELKKTYYDVAIKNLSEAEQILNQSKLF